MGTGLKQLCKILAAVILFCGASSITAHAQYDSLVIELPNVDPCEKLVSSFPADKIKMPPAFDKIRGKMAGKVNLNFETYALLSCNDLKQELTSKVEAQIKSLNPLPDLQTAAKAKLTGEANKIYDGFLFFVAEEFEAYLLADVPEDQKAAFTPGTAEADAAALKWAADAGSKLPDIVSAYLHSLAGSGNSTLGRVFDDYMSGASQEVIDGFGDILGKGQDRLTRFLDAKQEIVEQSADYTDTLKKYGFSGDWIKKLEENEKKLRQIDADYNAFEALQITYTAIQADEPDEKIRGFFQLIKHFGDVADGSNIPMVSLVGQIVAAYGDVAVQMLDGLDSLETAIRAREGFCVGLGTHAGRDKREAVLAEALSQQAGRADIRICPIRPGVSPWKDIFYVDQPDPSPYGLFFYVDGDTPKFIIGKDGHGGQETVQEAINLLSQPDANSFQALKDGAQNLEILAHVYNTDFVDDNRVKGLVALINNADETISLISKQRERLMARVEAKGGDCSGEHVYEAIQNRTGLDVFNFPDAFDYEGIERLKTRYALSHVDKLRTFAPSKTNRIAAYETYSNIAERIADLSLLQIKGEIERTDSDPCPECANAPISLSVSQGLELAGCRLRQSDEQGRFTANILTDSSDVRAVITANVPGGETEPYPVDMDYLAAHENIVSTPFVHTVSISYPVKIQDPEDTQDIPKLVLDAHSEAQRACSDYQRRARDAIDLADSWEDSANQIEASEREATQSNLSPEQAHRDMTVLFDAQQSLATQVEDKSAQACSAAKDSTAAWVSSAEERQGLIDKAEAALREAQSALDQMDANQQSARQIMASRPSGTASGAQTFLGDNYSEKAGNLLIDMPQMETKTAETFDQLRALETPYNRWIARDEANERRFGFDFTMQLAELQLCRKEAEGLAKQATQRLENLGASARETQPQTSPLWDEVTAMAGQVETELTAAKGILSEAQSCLGETPSPESAETDHSFLEQDWVGVQRLMSVYVKAKDFGVFECDSVSKCSAETNRWLTAENSRTPEDADWNKAIAGAIKQFFGLLFGGLQSGLVVDINPDGSLTLSSGDVGFGEMTAQSVRLIREDDDLYMGNATVNLEGIGPTKIGADLLISGDNRINVKTYIDMKNADGEARIEFDSDLQPGTLDVEAIKAANIAAFSNISVD